MNQFKLNRITGALIAAGLVLPSGFALAAQTDVTVASQAPKKAAGAMFVGSNATASKIRVTTTTTGATGVAPVPAVDVYYYNSTVSAGTVSVCPVQTVTDSNGSTLASTFAATLTCTTAAFDRVVLVYNAGTDTFGATGGTANMFAVMTNAGALNNFGSVSSAATALAGASAATNTVSAVSTYTGPIVTSAVQSTLNGTVALTFNANVSGDNAGTSTVSAAQNVNVNVQKVVNGANAGTSTFLITSTSTLDGLTVSSATAATAFTSAVNKVAIAAGVTSNIFDTAGNPTLGQTVYSNFSGTTGVAFASGSAKAIADTFSTVTTQAEKVDFWNPSLSTNGATAGSTFVVRLRANELLTGTFNTTTVSLTPAAAGTITVGAVSGMDQLINVTIATGSEIGVNAAGQLIVSTDNWATTGSAVMIGLTSNTNANISVLASGTAISTSGVAAVNVMAGSGTLPTVGYQTLDSDTDGFLDGYTVRTNNQFGMAYTPVQPSLTGTTGLSLINTVGTVTFASTTTAVGGTNLNVILTNKVSEDWDGNGTVNTTDAANHYNLTKFGTGNTQASSSIIPFRLNAAAVTPTTGTSALTYSGAFNTTDGNVLSLNQAEVALSQTNFQDAANPVVVKVDYTKVASQGEVVSGVARDEYGTVKITFSEPVVLGTIGEILLAGQPVTLKNLDKSVPQKAQQVLVAGEDPKTGLAFVGNSGISLTFIPNPTGNTLTFSAAGPDINETGGPATALDPLLTALSNSSAGVNTVAVAAPTGLTITGAKLVSVFAGATEINGIIVDFSQPVARATGAVDANLDGLFVVRARAGSTRVAAFENRDAVNPVTGGSVDSFYDFYISGANTLVGTAGLGGASSVTLFITETSTSVGLPADTTAIWVDYEGATSGTKSIRLASNQAVNAGNGAADNLFDTNATATTAGVLVSDPGSTAIAVDADTKTVTFNPLKLAANAATSASKNLLTQTIIGTAKGSGSDLGNNTAIRADLVVLEEPPALAGIPARDALLGDGGHIAAARGANSEDDTPQRLALRTTGVVTQKDFSDYAKAIRDYNAVLKSKVTDPGITNAQRIDELTKPERDVLTGKYLGTALASGNTTAYVAATVAGIGGKLNAFVEITTGAGKDASSGSNGANTNNANAQAGSSFTSGAQNANSEFGRTANLLKNVPNVQRNGTTYYPVTIDLFSGAINPVAGNNPITAGALNGFFPAGAEFLGTPATNARKVGFRVLDTAFALVKSGTYNVIVGAKEADFAGTTTPTSTSLLPATNVKDAFVQVSVFNGVSGEYMLSTSADPSFASTVSTAPAGHIKFAADLSKSVNIPTRHNLDLANIGETTIRSINGWQLLGIKGELARATTAPMQMRAFMTVDKDTGAPIANFEADQKGKDEAFSLGLDALAPNKLNVAFEGPNQTIVNNINPKPGAGLAFNYNTTFTAGTDGGTGPAAFNNPATPLQTDGRFNDAVAPTTLKWFYPIKSAAPTVGKLLKNSWHLITIQTDRTAGLNTAGSLPPGVDAAIIVDGQNGAKAWFRGEAATTAAGDAIVLKKGDAVFVHVGATEVPAGFAF